MLRFTNRRLFRLALRHWKALQAERDRTAELAAENDRMRAAIRKHQLTLDEQARGALPRLDRDDVDNALYNAVSTPKSD